MNSNTGDQSRQDLEARLDRILREPDPRATNTEPRQPEPVNTQPAFTPMSEPVVEQTVTAEKASRKSLSEYVRPFTKAMFGVLKSSRTWLMSVIRRSKNEGLRKSRDGFGKLLARARKLSGSKVNKTLAFVLGGVALTAATLLTVLVNFSYLTVTEGIQTTLGNSEDRSVLTLTASDANQGDLIVASLGIDNETDQEILVIGTVFSKNEQTYALYDGEVIWQITAEQIRGKVLFAEATETP